MWLYLLFYAGGRFVLHQIINFTTRVQITTFLQQHPTSKITIIAAALYPIHSINLCPLSFPFFVTFLQFNTFCPDHKGRYSLMGNSFLVENFLKFISTRKIFKGIIFDY